MAGKFTKMLVILVAAGLSGLPAQPMMHGPHGGPPKDVLDKLETLKMWKLTERLDLTDQQAAKLFPLMHRFREQKDSVAQYQKDLVEQLRDALDSGADTTQILEILDALAAAKQQECDLETKYYQQIRTILDARQQAEYVLFEVEFRRKMMKLIRDFHRGRRWRKHDENPWEDWE